MQAFSAKFTLKPSLGQAVFLFAVGKLHWPELDEDLSVAGLMAGVDSRSG
jgi:hypothetical protein